MLRDLFSRASDVEPSIALGEPRRRALEALERAFAHAQEENWDGVGSAAVEPTTFLYATQFLTALPSTTPAPEVAVDSDGELALEWDRGPRSVFSVSVGRDGTLTYAGLFGHTKVHGVEHLREAVPMAIASGIERVGASTPP